jgi:hypothetical protein
MAYQSLNDLTTWPELGADPSEQTASRAPHESEGAEARSTNDATPDRL